jgi:hypothetical protein
VVQIACEKGCDVPVYHFTIHAYRSWRPDHPRGYTRYAQGYQPSDSERAEEYDAAASQDAVEFDHRIQRIVLSLAASICEREGWRLELFGADPSHLHIVVSWRRYQRWEEADRRLKNLLALHLNRTNRTPGKRWFVRRHSAPRQVKNSKHFARLKDDYLPDHPGIFWKRGMPIPELE